MSPKGLGLVLAAFCVANAEVALPKPGDKAAAAISLSPVGGHLFSIVIAARNDLFWCDQRLQVWSQLSLPGSVRWLAGEASGGSCPSPSGCHTAALRRLFLPAAAAPWNWFPLCYAPPGT
ncbi:hypothetical protein PCASD_04036 [Puccinia coronata f. sp. avenae]|uniref:Uncharacterized protein n=1 Tax=Puccinia coronata f. sp. avenae TaxID=200324 RepID=A0A2N5V5I7_9BASI|nr:hypothetical protein PCASD_04036 [Puccinia coronata f. sp. avenae]